MHAPTTFDSLRLALEALRRRKPAYDVAVRLPNGSLVWAPDAAAAARLLERWRRIHPAKQS
jgi:hypothetical protein